MRRFRGGVDARYLRRRVYCRLIARLDRSQSIIFLSYTTKGHGGFDRSTILMRERYALWVLIDLTFRLRWQTKHWRLCRVEKKQKTKKHGVCPVGKYEPWMRSLALLPYTEMLPYTVTEKFVLSPSNPRLPPLHGI